MFDNQKYMSIIDHHKLVDLVKLKRKNLNIKGIYVRRLDINQSNAYSRRIIEQN